MGCHQETVEDDEDLKAWRRRQLGQSDLNRLEQASRRDRELLGLHTGLHRCWLHTLRQIHGSRRHPCGEIPCVAQDDWQDTRICPEDLR